MKVRTGLLAGMGESVAMVEAPDLADGMGADMASGPYINKWLGCWRCKGVKDQYGNVSQARCQMCWPIGAQPPV